MKLSEHKESKYIKAFVMGEPGTSKTVGALSFPTPIKVYDYDNKIGSAYSYYKKRDPERLTQIDVIKCNSTDDKGSGYKAMDADLTPIVREFRKSGQLPFETLVIDSSTIMASEMLNWLVHYETGLPRNSKVKSRKVAGMQDYMIFAPTFADFLGLILDLPCNIVMTGHIKVDQDELTGEIHRAAAIPGQMAKKIGIYFPEVYVTTVKADKYMAQTKADFKYPCRSQLQGIPKDVEFNYKTLAQYL